MMAKELSKGRIEYNKLSAALPPRVPTLAPATRTANSSVSLAVGFGTCSALSVRLLLCRWRGATHASRAAIV